MPPLLLLLLLLLLLSPPAPLGASPNDDDEEDAAVVVAAADVSIELDAAATSICCTADAMVGRLWKFVFGECKQAVAGPHSSFERACFTFLARRTNHAKPNQKPNTSSGTRWHTCIEAVIQATCRLDQLM